MVVIAEIEWISGRLRHGHFEVDVPEEQEEEFRQMSREKQIEYIEYHGHLLIDDFRIDDYGDINDIYY